MLKSFNIGVDVAKTIKCTSDNDDNETIMYASDNEVISYKENMEYDVMR